MLKTLDIITTFDYIQTLACIALIINAAEIIAQRQLYTSNGMYSHAIFKTSSPWMLKGWLAPFLDRVFYSPCYISLVSLQLVVAILLISHLFPSLSLLFLLIILLIQLLSHLRNPFGLDGSDQMQVLLFASLLIFSLSPDPLVKDCCLVFLSLQALLSYVTAGFAKLRSTPWREGTALRDILSTTSFGCPSFAPILVQHSSLSKAMCWAVILFECSFPLLVFAGVRPCLLFIAAGILFHFSTAIFMGLNTFFWSFVATYPALLFFASTFHPLLVLLLKGFLHH